jgi:subtilisin family serine protease
MSLSKALIAAAGNAGEDVSWDLDYAYYTGPDAWDISAADFIGTEYVGGQETFPEQGFMLLEARAMM